MEHWDLIESHAVVSSRWLAVLKNRYRHGEREVPDYYVVERADFVLVVAVDSSGNVLLVRQYRPATDSFYVSLPAGYIQDGEEPAQAARRELLEETGTVGHNWRRIGELHPLPGYIRSAAHVFRCDVVDLDADRPPRPDRPDEDEAVETLVLPREAVRGLIVSGQLLEMQAVAAFLLTEACEAGS